MLKCFYLQLMPVSVLEGKKKICILQMLVRILIPKMCQIMFCTSLNSWVPYTFVASYLQSMMQSSYMGPFSIPVERFVPALEFPVIR